MFEGGIARESPFLGGVDEESLRFGRWGGVGCSRL